ncbi:MAG TPA: GTPase ObgE [Acidimicrobiales bacterium]|nr:GTPase ObgE [Acidimicrobiales bacterium]
MPFVDESGLHVKAGNGGAGQVSYRREAHVPKGGPDGGDGGKGGDVWLVADRNIASLVGFKDHPHREAASGVHGGSKKAHGRRGKDLFVPVPEGTIVRDQDGRVIADLVHEGDRFLAAEGGRGGRGNASFLSNRRRAPSFAEQGEVGEERWLRLELKLMADVAIIGVPNAGKSTFIAAVSAAKPKIADYPFTTLVPNLGVVRMEDEFEMVLADIPGLIEGAAEGKGLGHQFLRHVERARVLLVLIALDPVETRSPDEQLEVLLHELGEYQPDLLERPRLVVGSKSDIAAHDFDGLTISAVTGAGTREVVGKLADMVRAVRAEVPEPVSYAVHRPAAESFRIERSDDGGYVVVGREAERAVAMNDLTNPEAMTVVHDRLKRLGVDRALARAGAKQGDRVRIGGLQFDYDD